MANPKDLAFRGFTAVHKAVFKATKGRLLGKFGPMPAVIITTTGRKSGQPRETMLTAPIVEDGKVVLVASYGGDSRHPAWYLNLRANPEVGVLMGGRSGTMTARTADADEKAELWPRITAAYKGYQGYQNRTDRDIPVVVLEPVAG